MRILSTVTIALLSGVFGGQLCAEERVAPVLAAEAKWDLARPTTVTVQISLRTKQRARIYESSLPWANRYSMILEGVKAKSGTALEKKFPIDDPFDTVVELEPLSQVSGEIDLARRFWKIEEALKEDDVILFWSFQLKTVEGESFNRVGGWVVMARTSE